MDQVPAEELCSLIAEALENATFLRDRAIAEYFVALSAQNPESAQLHMRQAQRILRDSNLLVLEAEQLKKWHEPQEPSRETLYNNLIQKIA